MSKKKAAEEEILQQEETAVEEPAAEEKNEANESMEKYLRLAAEFDNYKKRTIKERTQIAENSKADIIKEFLPEAVSAEEETKTVLAVPTSPQCEWP